MMTEMMGSMKQQMMKELEEYFTPGEHELDTGENSIVESDAKATSPPNYIKIRTPDECFY